MALSTDSRFFGLDLSQLKSDILKTWQKAPQWPPLSWLRPELALSLARADGTSAVVWESGQPAAGVKQTSGFWAVELPESMVLRKTMQLPPLDATDCASAAELEAQAISPFPAADLLWGYTELARSKTSVRLQLVLTSRSQVEPYVQTQLAQKQQGGTDSGKSGLPPEVWVLEAGRAPIVIQGFGEKARISAGRKKLLLNVLGVGLALLLVAAIALTPTAQLRFRAIEATHAYEAMAIKTTDVVAKREQLMQSADKVGALAELLAERVDSVKVLSMLTRVLPDDTALQSARVQGTKVTITGLTENASNLMQKLGSEEGVKDVRAPSAATRLGGGINKESFSIELVLDTKIFGPSVKADELESKPSDNAVASGTEQSPDPAKDGALSAEAGKNAASKDVVTPPPPAAPSKPAGAAAAPSNGPSVGGSKTGPSVGGARPPRQPRPAQGGQQ